MKFRIDCNSKQEMNTILDLLNSTYSFSDINILTKEKFGFLESNYFIELTTNDKTPVNNKRIQRFEYKIGCYYIYKNSLVQIIKIDINDKVAPYKCNIFSDTGRIINSKWVNCSALLPISAVSKIHITEPVNASTISKIKKDLAQKSIR